MNTRHSLPQHAVAATVALLLLPFAHKALHIAADGYAFAWTCFGIAYLLQRRLPNSAVWHFAAWLTFLAAVTDLPVLRDTITELTGAAW